MASRASILLKSDKGLKLFQLILPQLVMVNRKNKVNIDSPIGEGKKCFSVYFWKEKYLFKDHHSGVHGDIFELVALMNNLDSRTEFQKILEIMDGMLESNIPTVPDNEKHNYINTSNDDLICLVSPEYSKPFVNKYFMEFASFLRQVPAYTIQLVDSFELNEGSIKYEFAFAKPGENFYAIVVREEQYYILFNPKTFESFEFGEKPEYFEFGMDNLFINAYCKNMYLRETIVITNRVEGVLWCEDNSIPCIAIINDKLMLPVYITEFLLSKFEHKYLLFDSNKEGRKQIKSFTTNYHFKNIIIEESNLYEYFNRGEDALEKIIDSMADCDGYEYSGLTNPVRKLVDPNFQNPQSDFGIDEYFKN